MKDNFPPPRQSRTLQLPIRQLNRRAEQIRSDWLAEMRDLTRELRELRRQAYWKGVRR